MEKIEHEYAIPETLVEPEYEKNVLAEILKKQRFGASLFQSKALKLFAEAHDFDYVDMGLCKDESGRPMVAVGVREKIKEVLPQRLSEINVEKFSEDVATLLKKLGDMNVAGAVNVLYHTPFDKKRGFERPEVAIIEGALYGYKPCDVEYYLKTRYLDMPMYDEDRYENLQGKPENVICEKCAKELLESNKIAARI